jgi:uncharacterized protein (DUF2141 family)
LTCELLYDLKLFVIDLMAHMQEEKMALPTTLKAAALLSAAMMAAPALAGPVTVSLDNVEPGSGPIHVTVQTEGDFMQPRQTAGQIVRADGRTVTVALGDVPPGDYAVSVWHDRNGNGQFDRAADGMPLDGWAVSLNVPAATLRAAPTFAQARVSVTSAPLNLRLALVNPASNP